MCTNLTKIKMNGTSMDEWIRDNILIQVNQGNQQSQIYYLVLVVYNI